MNKTTGKTSPSAHTAPLMSELELARLGGGEVAYIKISPTRCKQRSDMRRKVTLPSPRFTEATPTRRPKEWKKPSDRAGPRAFACGKRRPFMTA